MSHAPRTGRQLSCRGLATAATTRSRWSLPCRRSHRAMCWRRTRCRCRAQQKKSPRVMMEPSRLFPSRAGTTAPCTQAIFTTAHRERRPRAGGRGCPSHGARRHQPGSAVRDRRARQRRPVAWWWRRRHGHNAPHLDQRRPDDWDHPAAVPLRGGLPMLLVQRHRRHRPADGQNLYPTRWQRAQRQSEVRAPRCMQRGTDRPRGLGGRSRCRSCAPPTRSPSSSTPTLLGCRSLTRRAARPPRGCPTLRCAERSLPMLTASVASPGVTASTTTNDFNVFIDLFFSPCP